MIDLKKDTQHLQTNADLLMKNMQKFSDILSEISTLVSEMLASGEHDIRPPFQMHEFFHALTTLGVNMMSKPQEAMIHQQKLIHSMMTIASHHLERFVSEGRSVATPEVSEAQGAAGANQAPLFDYLQDTYEAVRGWVNDQVDSLDDIDDHSKLKSRFYVRQLLDALSPRHFLFSNAELLRETLAENGENLVRGIKIYRDDLIAGHGFVKIRQTDMEHFKVGENIAATQGKVIFRNDLIELIQYQPTTEKVRRRPVLVVPPWINKFYVLDLSPKKSLIKWLVDQGNQVFILSWINPDARHRHKGWANYMHEGPLAALDIIKKVTGAQKIDTVGYCVGGTLLSIACAYLGAKADRSIGSMTLLTTQVDFTLAGELRVFIDEAQISAMEAEMAETGYLASSRMSMTFNLLRASDLIWAYVINNYLRGHKPKPFDLLFWNSDSTRMSEANHSFYLRGLYKDNLLAKGDMMIDGIKIDLKKIKVPVFNLAAREDHIAPAVSVFKGQGEFGGKVNFVLAGGGHIAGVINPPHRKKYYHMTGSSPNETLDGWIKGADKIEGSWWVTWLQWLRDQDNRQTPALTAPHPDFPALGDAPGAYVKMT